MSQKYQIIIQPAAQKGIEEAYFWLSNESARKARTWLEGLQKSILSLETMPFRCSFAFENNFLEQEVRQLIYGKGRSAYRIIFTILDDTVQIIFIRHAAQKPMFDDGDFDNLNEEESG
ncbi:MAG: type II toxin-antitoxin system RelE/ParE family toxin [Sphaerospermopsis sp. SIO1G1]|nr:type II toxin-antitoxin system RelE/ParE family toxin [Sphaerospermopsis sp. SIO1G1]